MPTSYRQLQARHYRETYKSPLRNRALRDALAKKTDDELNEIIAFAMDDAEELRNAQARAKVSRPVEAIKIGALALESSDVAAVARDVLHFRTVLYSRVAAIPSRR